MQSITRDGGSVSTSRIRLCMENDRLCLLVSKHALDRERRGTDAVIAIATVGTGSATRRSVKYSSLRAGVAGRHRRSITGVREPTPQCEDSVILGRHNDSW